MRFLQPSLFFPAHHFWKNVVFKQKLSRSWVFSLNVFWPQFFTVPYFVLWKLLKDFLHTFSLFLARIPPLSQLQQVRNTSWIRRFCVRLRRSCSLRHWKRTCDEEYWTPWNLLDAHMYCIRNLDRWEDPIIRGLCQFQGPGWQRWRPDWQGAREWYGYQSAHLGRNRNTWHASLRWNTIDDLQRNHRLSCTPLPFFPMQASSRLPRRLVHDRLPL